MPHAFVTGATGFVGRNLVEQLALQGWRITALHRPTSNIQALAAYPLEWVSGSLLDSECLLQVFPADVDAVFHVAGNTSVWSKHNAQQTLDNVTGTHNMVEAALTRGAKRFIHTSTWNVYGIEANRVINEDSPQLGFDSPINYNRSKSLAERCVKEAVARGLDAVIINPSHIIGRYDPGNWSRMIRLVKQQKLPGIPPGEGSFCHAEQVALTLIAAVDKGSVGENYLLGGADASFLKVIKLIGEITASRVPSRSVPATVLKAYAHLQTLMANIGGNEPELTPEAASMVSARSHIASHKAEKVLGYRPVPLRHMLEDCCQWMHDEGMLD